MKKTVFISSTYQDLVDHRRAVWKMLKGFNVIIRGMEEFGARTQTPLETCRAEVEQSDVYVGIVAFRAGTIEASSSKSFTQLEYEHALQLKKEILIYLADEENTRLLYKDIDVEVLPREKLEAFKGVLRERHTLATFSSPDDLAEKLKRDLSRYFESSSADGEQQKDEFDTSLNIVRNFLLMPKSVAGREARFQVIFLADPYPASRSLCQAFNLDYGLTIGAHIRVEQPRLDKQIIPFKEIYATGLNAKKLLKLLRAEKPVDLYATVEFSEKDVEKAMGVFFGYFPDDYDERGDPYVPAEGKAILLFSKGASTEKGTDLISDHPR
jgi:hypothetical protein